MDALDSIKAELAELRGAVDVAVAALRRVSTLVDELHVVTPTLRRQERPATAAPVPTPAEDAAPEGTPALPDEPPLFSPSGT